VAQVAGGASLGVGGAWSLEVAQVGADLPLRVGEKSGKAAEVAARWTVATRELHESCPADCLWWSGAAECPC